MLSAVATVNAQTLLACTGTMYPKLVQGVPGNNVQATVYRLYTCTDIRLERCAGVRKQWIICNNGDHIRLIKYISLQKNIKS